MVIFDTNVLVSAAILAGSRADCCVRATLEQGIPLTFSDLTFAELHDVLMREKFDRYVSSRSRLELLSVWRAAAFIIPATAIREVVTDCRDPTDNKFLELALAASAKVVVTGDPDLLVLDPWRNIRILGLTDFAAAMAR